MHSVDQLSVKWMGFYKTSDEAQRVLEEKTKKLGENYLIVSSSKQLLDNNSLNKKEFLLFKFTIVKAFKEGK
jgi:hypothetical protein